MTFSVFKDLLNADIKWHEKNSGKSDKGELFEAGFVAGLKQAKLLAAIKPVEASA